MTFYYLYVGIKNAEHVVQLSSMISIFEQLNTKQDNPKKKKKPTLLNGTYDNLLEGAHALLWFFNF